MTTPTLHPDYREFIASLQRQGVRFLVVGAHALAVLGRARVTDDLDILVEPTPENAARVAQALRDFGGFDRVAAAAERQLDSVGRMLTIGRQPVAIDILTSISGVDFEQAWLGRQIVDTDAGPMPVLGRTEYVANKRAAGRPKDLADLELLREIGVDVGD